MARRSAGARSRLGGRGLRERDQRVVRARWQGVVEEFRRSGKTEAVYCRQRGVGLCALRWWLTRLSAGEPRRPPTAVASRAPATTAAFLSRGTGSTKFAQPEVEASQPRPTLAAAACTAIGGRSPRPSAGEERWTRVLDEWRVSGITQVAFATRAGISVHSLRWWKWELARRALARGVGPAAANKPATPRAENNPMFLPVVVKPPRPVGEEAGSRGSKQQAPLELMLRSGRRIRVRGNFDEAVMARLIRVAETTA